MSGKIIVKYAEAAKMLSTSTQTIKRLVRAGRLKGVILTGNKRCSGVTVESLEALAQGRD